MQPVPSWLSLAVVAGMVAGAWLAQQLWSAATDRAGRPAPQPHLRTYLWLALVCAGIVTALTLAVLTSPLPDAFDAYVRTAVRGLYDTAFIRVCLFITAFGNTATLAVASGLTIAALFYRRHRCLALGLGISALGSQLTTYVLKYAIGRERPAFEAFAHAATPSFPSAHATGAVAVYGFLAYVLSRRLPARARRACHFWGSVCILLLAASRVVIGVHYLSDVLAGLLIGACWLALACATMAYLALRTGR